MLLFKKTGQCPVFLCVASIEPKNGTEGGGFGVLPSMLGIRPGGGKTMNNALNEFRHQTHIMNVVGQVSSMAL